MKTLQKTMRFRLLFLMTTIFVFNNLYSRDNQVKPINSVSLMHGIIKNSAAKVKLPLHEIILNQDLSIQEKLNLIQETLDNGTVDVNTTDPSGKTALNLVTFYKGDSLLAEILIKKYKADVNKPDRFNVSPLHNAIEKEEIEIAQMLLDAGADRYLKNDADEITPVDLARSPNTIALLGLIQ